MQITYTHADHSPRANEVAAHEKNMPIMNPNETRPVMSLRAMSLGLRFGMLYYCTFEKPLARGAVKDQEPSLSPSVPPPPIVEAPQRTRVIGVLILIALRRLI
jgi:hypothetical protein